MNESMNECRNVWMDNEINEGMNVWINEGMYEWFEWVTD